MIIHKPYTNDKYAYGYKLRSSTCIVVIELIIKNCQFIGAGPKRSLCLYMFQKAGPLIAIINKYNQHLYANSVYKIWFDGKVIRTPPKMVIDNLQIDRKRMKRE